MKTIPGAPRTEIGQQALALYNDVQLCHELHWTLEELDNTPEDFVWAVMTVLSLESEKMEDEMKDRDRSSSSSSGRSYRSVDIPPAPPPPH